MIQVEAFYAVALLAVVELVVIVVLAFRIENMMPVPLLKDMLAVARGQAEQTKTNSDDAVVAIGSAVVSWLEDRQTESESPQGGNNPPQ